MRFPGTIIVPEAAFETILEYAARSFKLHGFKDVARREHRRRDRSKSPMIIIANQSWKASRARSNSIRARRRSARPIAVGV
jgi:creatinine amidohydrolase